MNDILTLFGNNLFILASIGGLFFVSKWYINDHLSDANKDLIVSLWCIFTAVFIRIGWWSVAIALEGTNKVGVYHPFFYDWKWLLTLITSVIYTIGVVLFVHVIENLDFRTRVILTTAAFSTAALFAVI